MTACSVPLQATWPALAVGSLLEVTAAKVSCDSDCQTVVHPVSEYIDRDYEWNEWALRKKALDVVNLRRKRTSSQQTELSHFRRENQTQVSTAPPQTGGVLSRLLQRLPSTSPPHLLLHQLLQVWLPKGTATQTRVNKGQTMPRMSQHLAGLQGGPGTKVKLIRLELDLGQPYQY